MLSPDRVLYEDNHLLAVVKEAGDLTQGDKTGDRCLLDVARSYIKRKYNKPGEVYLGLVHRLDRPVSGVLLFARTSKAAGRLSEQWRSRQPAKIYHAIVEGNMPDLTGRLEHFLTGEKHRLKVSVSTTKPAGEAKNTKEAKLQYTVLEEWRGRSLVEVELLTGYKHQIRAQLAAVGCPIVGDFKYDRRQKPLEPSPLAEGRAIALHAIRLTVEHPTRKEAVTFAAPYPAYWPWRQVMR